jgi:hypothetical protein
VWWEIYRCVYRGQYSNKLRATVCVCVYFVCTQVRRRGACTRPFLLRLIVLDDGYIISLALPSGTARGNKARARGLTRARVVMADHPQKSSSGPLRENAAGQRLRKKCIFITDASDVLADDLASCAVCFANCRRPNSASKNAFAS